MKKKTPVVDDPYRARMAQISVVLARELHESMKEIRLARRWMTRSDIRLCLLYQEAVEKYVEGKPQQELLNEYRERLSAGRFVSRPRRPSAPRGLR